jgi:hypothetical protein
VVGAGNAAVAARPEEVLPVVERLGNVRLRAMTLGKIADMLSARGELDQALAMWRESLAVFVRLAEPGLIASARKKIARFEARRD